MKRMYSVTDFSTGVNELDSRAASDLVNFDVQSDGSLVTRQGFVSTEVLGGSPMSGTVLQMFFANDKMFVQTNQGLYFRSGAGAFTVVTNSCLLYTSPSPRD